MAGKYKRSEEWVGGLFAMPAEAPGEGSFRPEALFWMDTHGEVLGQIVGMPGTLLARAAASLREAIEHPASGQPRSPQRVRVATPELAGALRAAHPTIEIVCAPTPEIDEIVEVMQELGDGDEGNDVTTGSYLSPDIDAAAIGALFRAAATLFRAQPWTLVPLDDGLISVTIDSLGLKDAPAAMMRHPDEQKCGILLFASMDQFEAYLDTADAFGEGAPPLPPHVALNFVRGPKLSEDLRKEIAEHRWEVAGEDAYPWLLTADAELVARPTTPVDVTTLEAIALAIAKVFEEKEALVAAVDAGEMLTRTLSVPTHSGDIEVSLRIPYEPNEYRPPYDLLAGFRKLEEEADGEVLDPDIHARLEAELLRRFRVSPEGKELPDPFYALEVMDLAARFFHQSIATIGARKLREILFDLIPTKTSFGEDDALPIIDTLRALYTYMKRELGLPQADECLGVVGDGAVDKLEDALADDGEYAALANLLVEGRAAGYDMESEEGMRAWMRVVESRKRPPSALLPAPYVSSPIDPAKARAKKNQRKAARKARKKNR